MGAGGPSIPSLVLVVTGKVVTEGSGTSAGGTSTDWTSVGVTTSVGESVVGGTTSVGETSVDDGTEEGVLVTDDRLALPGNSTSLEDSGVCVSSGSSLDNVVVGSKGGTVLAIELVL